MAIQVESALAKAEGSVNASPRLILHVNGKDLTSGEDVPRQEVEHAPSMNLEGGRSTPYTIIVLDLDPPYGSTPFLGPLLHWHQSGVTVASDNSLKLSSNKGNIDWLAPTPPPLSGPHRYLFILYEEGKEYDSEHVKSAFGESISTFSRLRWDVDTFVEKAGLGSVVAATYFKSS